jgi:hypothetical protein
LTTWQQIGFPELYYSIERIFGGKNSLKLIDFKEEEKIIINLKLPYLGNRS